VVLELYELWDDVIICVLGMPSSIVSWLGKTEFAECILSPGY